jgi:hypothetical protein
MFNRLYTIQNVVCRKYKTMNTYAIWYSPIWGQMTRYCEYVKASSQRHAEMKFYGTKAGDNCQSILQIECC